MRKKKTGSNRSTNKRTETKKKGTFLKNTLLNLLIIILLLIGLALIFNNQIKDFLVKNATNRHTITHVTRDDVLKNEQKEGNFDFSKVESLDFNTVAQATIMPNNDIGAIGGIAIPDVNLNLPIFKGVSNDVLAIGAGTMKEDQAMGKGNYALASHHMINPNLLFSPLVNIEVGTSVFLTDLDYIYEYKVTSKEYVEPTRVDVIDDVKDKQLVTLVTCDTTGANRLIVQGELVRKVKGTKAPEYMQSAFETDQNNY